MTETKWDKGDRLRITIEADATSKHDYPTIFIKSALDYPMGLNVSGIESAGGTVSVEVLPKLPDGKYAQVIILHMNRNTLATRMEEGDWSVAGFGFKMDDSSVIENYICTISEGQEQ